MTRKPMTQEQKLRARIATRKWQDKNRNKQIQYNREYYKRNKVKINARNKRYRQNNKEKCYINHKKYRLAHLHRLRELSRNADHRKNSGRFKRKYKNVYLIRATGKYKVQFGINNKNVYFGTYFTLVSAKKTAKRLRIELKIRFPGARIL